jgi:hypothetical protein
MTKCIEHIFEDGLEKRYCGRCKTFKIIDSFGFCNSTWDKLRPTCKNCLKEINYSNKTKRTTYNKMYWEKTKEQQKEKNKKWREQNKEKIKENNKKWIDRNKEHKKLKDKEYREQNWDKKKSYMRIWKQQNYQKIKNDPTRINEFSNYKIKSNTSRRIREILGQQKSHSCMDYVGCSLDKFRIHLESSLEDGMSWNNYGTNIHGSMKYVWHIDHIIPCDAFDMNNSVERFACFHYKNLKACWWDQNIKKSNNYVPQQKQLYIQKFIDTYVL